MKFLNLHKATWGYISGYILKAYKACGPSYFPPKTIFALFFSPSSIANFISSPGLNGVKSVGNPDLKMNLLENTLNAQSQMERRTLQSIPLRLF